MHMVSSILSYTRYSTELCVYCPIYMYGMGFGYDWVNQFSKRDQLPHPLVYPDPSTVKDCQSCGRDTLLVDGFGSVDGWPPKKRPAVSLGGCGDEARDWPRPGMRLLAGCSAPFRPSLSFRMTFVSFRRTIDSLQVCHVIFVEGGRWVFLSEERARAGKVVPPQTAGNCLAYGRRTENPSLGKEPMQPFEHQSGRLRPGGTFQHLGAFTLPMILSTPTAPHLHIKPFNAHPTHINHPMTTPRPPQPYPGIPKKECVYPSPERTPRYSPVILPESLAHSARVSARDTQTDR
ncbi:hypothetical protein B0J18DRAFT_151784 [Chaetomium sp. MPI-SDFR-AT-0129]|nr:hypothetical protein B0J18DRAFT_151784 [Chaetomium sp. MPI-SDFR-AT-0129]